MVIAAMKLKDTCSLEGMQAAHWPGETPEGHVSSPCVVPPQGSVIAGIEEEGSVVGCLADEPLGKDWGI